MINHILSYFAFIFITIVETLRNRKTWLLVAFITWTYLIAWVNSNYYFQSPVKEWQCMACSRSIKFAPKTPQIATISAEIVPTVIALKEVRSEKEIIMAQPHGEILWKIYMLESTRGNNDGCRLKGQGWGGFGVMSAGKVVCYESFEKAVERAEYWLARLNPDKDLIGAICQWNTGSRGAINCSYYQSYLSL